MPMGEVDYIFNFLTLLETVITIIYWCWDIEKLFAINEESTIAPFWFFFLLIV